MTKKESVLKFFLLGLCACALVFSLAKPALAAEAAFAALSLCARRVVPGVFLFMAAAKFFAGCGAARAFSRFTHGALERLFRVSAGGAAVIFLGLLSGYPTGAAVAGELIKRGELSAREAERILPFATAASPAFLVASVGAMCGGAGFGFAMLFSQLASALMLLFLTRPKAPARASGQGTRAQIRPLSVFTAAIKESGAAALNICSFVTFFYVFSAMLYSFLPPALAGGALGALTAGICEISCGFARLGGAAQGLWRFFLGGLMLGFAGFSVLLQSADAVGTEAVSMKKYLLGKAVQALLTGVFAVIFGAVSFFFGAKETFFFFGALQAEISAIWQTCLLFFAFCLLLVPLLIFIIKFFILFKKIFKKLWKKSNL